MALTRRQVKKQLFSEMEYESNSTHPLLKQTKLTKPTKRSIKRKAQPTEDKVSKKPKLASGVNVKCEKTTGTKRATRTVQCLEEKDSASIKKQTTNQLTRSTTRVTKCKAQPTEGEHSTSPKKLLRKRAQVSLNESKNKGTTSSKKLTEKSVNFSSKASTSKKGTKISSKEPIQSTKKSVKTPKESGYILDKPSETKATKNETAKIVTVKGDVKNVVKTKRRQKKKGHIEDGMEEIKEAVSGVEVKEESTVSGGAEMAVEISPCFKGAKYIGAHMGIAGGLDKAVIRATEIGAKAFALFLRSQRQWQAKPLDDKVAEKFRTACKDHNFSPWHILPHGSYLVNCGSPNPETLQKSRDTLTDELKRCEKLGLAMYNFHPGSTCGQMSVGECLNKIGESINIVHKQTNSVMTVIENMSCQGNTVGGKFEELAGIIDRVEDKSRVGVCLDTCHAFAAGFDLATDSGYESMMEDFDRIVGLKYLKAVHLNDSKGKVGSHLDRHENIGKGFIGLEAFRRIMNDPRFDGIPIVLETPAEDDNTYEKEIRLLYSMQDTKK